MHHYQKDPCYSKHFLQKLQFDFSAVVEVSATLSLCDVDPQLLPSQGEDCLYPNAFLYLHGQSLAYMTLLWEGQPRSCLNPMIVVVLVYSNIKLAVKSFFWDKLPSVGIFHLEDNLKWLHEVAQQLSS